MNESVDAWMMTERADGNMSGNHNSNRNLQTYKASLEGTGQQLIHDESEIQDRWKYEKRTDGLTVREADGRMILSDETGCVFRFAE